MAIFRDTIAYMSGALQRTDRDLIGLCLHCEDLADNWDSFLAGATLPHYSDEASFQASALSCKLCSQLILSAHDSHRGALNHHYNENGSPRGGIERLHNSDRLTGEPLPKYDEIQLIIPLVIGLETIREDGITEVDESEWLNFSTRWCFEDRLDIDSSVTPIPDFMSTRDGLSRVKKWYNDCLTIHTECRPPEDQFLPTRLLYVCSDNVRLCHSICVAHRQPYATLSHCWGDVRFQTLLKSNLNAFQEDIPLEALSRTFLDAIEVARLLGFQYLWIDSLCIIQDDENDWVKESASMCDVYNGSSLNLAASGAKDGNVGLFHPRSSVWRCRIPLTTATEDPAHKHIECFSPGIERSIKDNVLSQRGWVVQERILSHRTIHFTYHQIFWECNAHICCEIFSGAVAEYDDRALRKPYTKGKPTVQSWDSIVRAFSRCNLTHDSDKLVAISGLAQLIHSDSGVDFVAGMWRQNLAVQLCWFVETGRISTRYKQYIAPSWAWASVHTSQAGIKAPSINRQTHKEYITIKDITIQHTTKSPFGPISSAVLQISCEFITRVILCCFEPTMLGITRFHIGKEILSCFLKPDYADTFSEYFFREIFLVLVTGIDDRFLGLIIAPVDGKGRFERIGVFKMPGDDAPIILAILAGVDAIDEEDCLDVVLEDGNKRYIIDLV